MSSSKSLGFICCGLGISHTHRCSSFSSALCFVCDRSWGEAVPLNYLGRYLKWQAVVRAGLRGANSVPSTVWLQTHTPAAATAGLVWQHWNTGTLVQWGSKGRGVGGRSILWCLLVFLHATRRMNCSAFLCLFVQTSCAKCLRSAGCHTGLQSTRHSDRNLCCVCWCSWQGAKVRTRVSV